RSLERVPGLTMPAVGVSPLLATQCTGVTHDSRRVGRGSIFAQRRGLKANGAAFAPEAIAAGASAIVAESPAPADVTVPWIVVTYARVALGWSCRRCT